MFARIDCFISLALIFADPVIPRTSPHISDLSNIAICATIIVDMRMKSNLWILELHVNIVTAMNFVIWNQYLLLIKVRREHGS